MLGNNEKIQGVDLKAVFTKMLSEVPWESLKAYILSNAPLVRLCTAGGFRLEPKQRARDEKFIMRDAEKGGFSEVLCNGVFASWYPVHKELHKNLEDYFHSDEYKAYREANKLGEDDYVLPDDKFNSVYSVKEFEAWRILLCFSPLKFTAEQAKVILEDKKGDADLMARINTAEAKVAELTRKVTQMSADAERNRARQQEDQAEIQELRKTARQSKNEAEQLQKRLETALNEMKRANMQVAQADTVLSQREAEIREELGRTLQRQQGEVERLSKELSAWQARHEEQCGINRNLVERAEAADKRCAEAEASRDIFAQKVDDNIRAVDALLGRIDWPRVGASMKPSPTVRRNINSLLKRLDYDANRNLSIEGSLTSFWERLSRSERELIGAIARSSEKELVNGSIKDYWQSIADRFPEVLINLEARMAMLGILQEIFFQTFSDEELEEMIQGTSVATKARKTRKKADEE